jgi:CubicO group peptidase (beta-lactamase class C family)
MSEGASSHLTARFERLRRKTPVVVLGTLVEGRREVVVVGESQGGLEESIFEIGSITKTFTALLLAEMCDSGEVALSDPLSKFISSMTRDNGIREITLLDLATHTARFPRVPRDLMWEALSNRSNPYARYHHDRLIEEGQTFSKPEGGRPEVSVFKLQFRTTWLCPRASSGHSI